MNTFVQRFKVNGPKAQALRANVLYDFVIVAIATLIFNGFIINSHSSSFDQKVFMVMNAGLLSTHWYAKTFFTQRYEKKGMDFRALMVFSIFSLGAMAVSIDLMVFAKNSSTIEFLTRTGFYIWLVGFIGSRLMMGFNYMMAAIANKNDRALFELTLYKSIARYVNVAIAITGIILLATGSDKSILIYTMLPIMVAIEFLGNVWKVNKANLDKAPAVSYEFLRERYSKINNLLISAFMISGTIQFAFYFKDSSDMDMLWRIALVYVITFLLWWTYSNRVYRFDIKKEASSHIIISGLNMFIAMALSVVGGMLINANNDHNLDSIIPSVFFGLTAFFILISAILLQLRARKEDEEFSKQIKLKFVYQALVAIVILLTLGIISLFIDITAWGMYGAVIGVLLWTTFSSRYTIEKYVKKPRA